MTTDSRQRRSIFGYQRFLLSAFYTLSFLSLYLLGSWYIPAPESYLKCLGKLLVQRKNLFSSLLNYQTQVSFTISILLAFSTAFIGIFQKKQEIEQKQKIRDTLLTLFKFLKPNIIAFSWIFSYWGLIKNSPYLIFLTYLSLFVSNSLFELIMEFIDKYGVCRGFELLFFVERFPFKLSWKLFSSLFKTIFLVGSHSDLRNVFSLLSVSVIVYLFVSMLDRKWEIPIDTNKVALSENNINYSSTFFLQMNFSTFWFIFISVFIKGCGVFWCFLSKRLKGPLSSSSASELLNLWGDFSRFSINSSSFREVIFAINNATNPFFNFYQRGKRNVNYFPAIICWTFLIHFINWLIISNSQFNSQEISENLEKRGAYLDSTRPGDETKKLVSSAINVLVALWALHLTLLAMCFDNTFSNLVENDNNLEKREPLGLLNDERIYDCQSFFSLVTTVSTATDLSKQIRKNYDHSKFYD